ncbi:hypothetical protein BH09BAC4_BH09BAC4_28700 [soil metagenome]
MKNQSSLPGAFLGKSGSLYIRVRKVIPENNELYTTQTAVYPSVESYNKRSAIPHYVELSTVADDFSAEVSIDMDTLTINIPNG